MKPDWWPGADHERFTEWALSQGIEVNGVSPARFPGRGLGMIATRNIEEDEAIVIVPLKAMLTIERVPASFTSRFPAGTAVHAIVAAFLTNGDAADLRAYELWRKTWPSRQDFEDSMPILWPSSLRGPDGQAPGATVLPPSISGAWNTITKRKIEHEYETPHQNLLPQQEKRLQQAWDSVVAVFPDTDWESFSYHWLIVNTRCFYYLMPGEEPPEDSNDAMAMLPFADYFNHSDVACNVKFDGEKYVFRATKHYDGFYLDKNESEMLYLDDIIFQDLSPDLHEELNFQQYYGNYQVTAEGACYRTEIAACMKYMALDDWRNYALGYSTKGVDAGKTAAVIKEWIATYANEARTATSLLKSATSDAQDPKNQEKLDWLLKRWRQIEDLCKTAIDAVVC
ncbi:ribosomal N-lysine methyltransferase [Aspergillus terreus]|uniref:Ribosomal N-lysine methyltransferase n=1 Tax=Aspergillus terreus TaxID=33178 RepID=A0A5M3ZB29_ASPTE|nr:hypothetical protein ATETN484_0012030300 [Aspergillus terreus]GFF19551.1 ribosomal N-lysine methyltransferase [Aspergillus terreus]